MSDDDRETIEIDGRAVTITKPSRVLWPSIGWTKRDLIVYLRAVAPAMLPHLRGRAVTLARFPEGVDARGWYQTNAPRGAPAWLRTVSLISPAGKALTMCLVEDEASLVWAAGQGTLELHAYLAPIDRPDAPHALVIDLDPRAPAGLIDAARVALDARAKLEARGLRALAKTSGAKGVHVFAPVSGATYAETKAIAREIAKELTAADPSRITDRMAKAAGAGKVLVDWGQNDAWKSIVVPYSPRATVVPLVSTPVTWDEVELAVRASAPSGLRFAPDVVIARLAQHGGDLFAPVLGERHARLS
ncbi:non-homologous end-joining DNA ligase [Sandaracinus amylolyticus]|uniref:ATP-dependent DNA ligase n=1 Tax=Sandaracinus amylolyticus TaxID=927083 RepID=A0A0F6YG38_9BACT|nr:non-homologous end-joining DNA ligase [Sandaracinus amylolyticus]AKF03197.1 ATP-dependent DNA ligase [Sandaracinus amylolyticus]